MPFWSGEKLSSRIAEIVEFGDASMIDGAAVKLTVGAEVYVSPIEAKGAVSIRALSPDEAFAIPPGQFAFLITEERVQVPKDAMAFISIRARTKWRGLLNVSGFHADPGYNGRLIFSVLNGSPASIHLRRGEYCFLMWMADLDQPTTAFAREQPGYDRIPSELVSNISSEFKTVAGVAKALDDLRLELRVTQSTVGVLVGLVIAMAIRVFFPTAPSVNSTQSVAPVSAPPVPTAVGTGSKHTQPFTAPPPAAVPQKRSSSR